jgi:hypothetical protein
VTADDRAGLAARLGLPPEALSGLDRRGLLARLELDDAELRERLWRGHLAHLRFALPTEEGADAHDANGAG